MPPERTPICVIDAFTRSPFRGNPAAVCLLKRTEPDAWMQAIAAELNLSETAFLVPAAEPDAFQLRWFTPVVEVNLCGHATLASAHCLWERGGVPPARDLTFLTRSGTLRCRREDDRIAMNFPARCAVPTEPPAGLDRALGCTPRWVGRSADDLLVEVADATTVQNLRPDFNLLAQVPTRGVIVTAASAQPGHDFVSRFFAPAVGVPEDPVTGSAHCTLAPFWAQRLGRSRLQGWQASARGGSVGVRLEQDRVWLLGEAVTVWSGELA